MQFRPELRRRPKPWDGNIPRVGANGLMLAGFQVVCQGMDEERGEKKVAMTNLDSC